MSYGYVPAWVFCVPDKDDPNFGEYLLNQASKDGMPEHVRQSLLKFYNARKKRERSEDV